MSDDRSGAINNFESDLDALDDNPWFQVPDDPTETREIEGQLCMWDNDALECFGQMWIPVCRTCRRGPINKDEQMCGGDRCIYPNDPEWMI